MAALGTSVDLSRIGSNLTGVWHIVQRREFGSLETLGGAQADIVEGLCGRRGKQAGNVESGVDANVVQHKGVKVCADCKVIIDAGGSPQEEEPQVATTTKPKSKTKRTGEENAKSVTAADLKKAISRAEKAIASQPVRTERDLTQAQADKAFKLGKSIAADRYNLKNAEPGKTSAYIVAGIVERIEARVEERNKLRRGK